jgi:hypothetical protein
MTQPKAAPMYMTRTARSRRFAQHELPTCPRSGKVRYRDHAQARFALSGMRALRLAAEANGVESARQEVRVYQCGMCDGWHATSQALAA